VAYLVAWSYLFIAAFLGAKPPPAPLFPPGAVLLAALVLTPPRRWALYLGAAFVIQVPILAYLRVPLWWNVLGFIPDAIEPVFAVSLMRWVLSLPPRFASLREVTRYTACVVVAVMVAATVGAAVNATAGGEPYWTSWRTWFLADTLADLVLAPALILWMAVGSRGLQAGSRRRYAEASLLYGGLLVMGAIVFNIGVHDSEAADVLNYLPVPLLLWAAVRFGPRGITSALSLIAVLAIPAVADALGPFASRSTPPATVLDNVFDLQLFLLVIGVPLLFLAALVQEREGTRAGLRAEIIERTRLEREREAARAMAERQAEQLDRMFEGMADGVVVYDAQGLTVRTNAAARRLLGLDAAPPDYAHLPLPERIALYQMRDEQGRPVDPEDAPSARALRGEVLTGTQSKDLQLRTLDGHEVKVNSSAAPLRDREGHLVGAVNILHDQTERKRLERERADARASELAQREVNRHMEQFLATASHDLRTPITGVVLGIDLAQRRLQQLAAAVRPTPRASTGDHPAAQHNAIPAALNALERADGAAQRLSQLILRLFDIAQARTGTLELQRAACDLAALVREQVAAQRALVPERTIRLDLEADVAVPVVADGDRLGQVLANYLTNALKYSPADQPVVVSLTVQAGQARVAVRDAGPGLPPEEQARVWEPFYRAPAVAAQGSWGGSMGLGLYICQQIVERHGGQVGVESAVGAGSNFWFTLPLPRTP
jgi:signal transduction histidine kinase/integral membrane sensor domain MASE1